MNFGKWHALAVGVLFLVLAGLIFITSDPRSAASGPEVLLREAMAPVQTALSAVSRWGSEAVATLGSLGALRAENRELRQEAAALRAELRSLQLEAAENERLREILDLKERLPYTTLVAQVVARPAEQWFSTVVINRGSNDGLHSGMPVINADGVVGHIESVTPNSARVLLIVDPASAVGGVILTTETPVLVEGSTDPSGRTAVVRPLVHGAPLRPGDIVVTSGLSQIFPRGLPIGVVESVESVSDLQVQGILRPVVDFTWLDWVAVIVEPEGRP